MISALSCFSLPLQSYDSICLPVGYFKSRYRLSGKDWIRKISIEDRQALCHYAFVKSDYGRQGGKARSNQAIRDERGRFLPNPPRLIKASQLDEIDTESIKANDSQGENKNVCSI